MKRIELTFNFRGSRNYLHGTDIYPAILNTVEQEVGGAISGPVSISFKGFSDTQFDLILFEDADTFSKPEASVVYFDVAINNKHVQGWLVQSSRPVIDRTPFDEDAICVNMALGSDSLMNTSKFDLPAIDVLIPMTKFMHQSLLPAENSRWILSKLELDRPLTETDIAGLRINLIQNLGNRLTKSLVTSYDKPIGHIYFSWIAS